MEPNNKRTRASRPQKRGVRRREALLGSALKLLSEAAFADITYQRIADGAGVPLASCYHFYRSKLDLVRSLADELTERYLETVFADANYRDATTWQDCIVTHVNNTVAYHNRSPAELQIFFSGDVPLKLRQDALNREKIIGHKLLELVAARFDIPSIERPDAIFFRAVEIGRTVLALDIQETGRLDEASATEAVRAMIGYLANYLPGVVARRTREGQ